MIYRDYIDKAFLGDEKIYEFFDPTATVKNHDDIINNVSDKILEYEDLFEGFAFHGFDNGYVCYMPGMLFSFGINVSERKTNRLWDEITKCLNGDFVCLLWSKNTRAINWLVKNGVVIEDEFEYENNKITKLNYNICH